MPFLKGGFDPRGSLFLGHYFGSKQNMISVSTSKNHCLLGAGQCRQSRATWLVSKRRIRPRNGFDVTSKEDSKLHNVSRFLGHVIWSTNSNSLSSPLKFNRASFQVVYPNSLISQPWLYRWSEQTPSPALLTSRVKPES